MMQANGFPLRREGIVFILSAPSGAGKTTLTKKLLQAFPDLTLSVSYTTRAPRPGEKPGKDYHFVTEGRFIKMRDENAFAEWAQVHGSLYGTAGGPLDRLLKRGRDVLLDIDVQGARKIRLRYPSAVSIFVLPPSWKELEKRLARRGTDRSEVIRRRLQNARSEIREIVRYDYVVVNSEIRESVASVISIVRAERLKIARIRKWHPADGSRFLPHEQRAKP
jgi:guanylate kinase